MPKKVFEFESYDNNYKNIEEVLDFIKNIIPKGGFVIVELVEN